MNAHSVHGDHPDSGAAMREQSRMRETWNMTEWKHRRQIEYSRISMKTRTAPAATLDIIVPHPENFMSETASVNSHTETRIFDERL
jgi:hypothetical protein